MMSGSPRIAARAAVAACLSVLLFVGAPDLDLGGMRMLAPALMYGAVVLAPEVRAEGSTTALGERIRVVLWALGAYWIALMAYLPLQGLAGREAGFMAVPVVGAGAVALLVHRVLRLTVSRARTAAAVMVGFVSGAIGILESVGRADSSPTGWGLAASVAVWQVGTAVVLLTRRDDR